MKFCNFVGNSNPHMYANICGFILIFHQMALIFPQVRYSSFSPCQVLSIHTENENPVYQLFGNDIIFSSSRVLVSDNCKQSITVQLIVRFWPPSATVVSTSLFAFLSSLQLCLHRLLMSAGCKCSHSGFLDVSCSNDGLRISGWISQLSCLTIYRPWIMC